MLKTAGIPFTELLIPIYTEAGKAQLHALSAADKVPLLITPEQTIWDSLAIAEYVAEQHPGKHLWPQDTQQRAMARSVSSEMHSSFPTLRNDLPMNCRLSGKYNNISRELQNDIARVCQIWRECRQVANQAGDFLFGPFSIADAFYAPVALRFNSYQVAVGDVEKQYMQAILALPGIQEWVASAKKDSLVVEDYEIL